MENRSFPALLAALAMLSLVAACATLPENVGRKETFAYPDTVLNYLFTQIFLLDEPYLTEVGVFDPCGVASGTPDEATCETDFDLDGVSNDAEPLPSSFQQQVLVEQCSAGLAEPIPAVPSFTPRASRVLKPNA